MQRKCNQKDIRHLISFEYLNDVVLSSLKHMKINSKPTFMLTIDCGTPDNARQLLDNFSACQQANSPTASNVKQILRNIASVSGSRLI